jgi:L-2-hydroxyglutarate oxidase
MIMGNVRNYDVVVVGGGIVGLATAMALKKSYPKTKIVVLEKEDGIALHQTGHNSGVIHAGLYYRPGSQKAGFSVNGGKKLRNFCDEHDIPYELVGKVVVATSDAEISALENLYQRGIANGIEGLEVINSSQLADIEPHAFGVRAIRCPATGIVDYSKVAQAYSSLMQEDQVELILGTEVLGVTELNGKIHVSTTTSDLESQYLINCSGLYADQLAEKMGLNTGLRIIPFRGEYYVLRPERSYLVNGLIYPVPNPEFPFLGVHFTKRIGGSVEAGPNAVLAWAREGYRHLDINPSEFVATLKFGGFWRMVGKYWKTGMGEFYRSLSKSAFIDALRVMMPEIGSSDLVRAGAGVRAQAVDSQGNLVDDFRIVSSHRSIHVLNAPSPAATASLSIGEHIRDIAAETFQLPK